MSPTTVTLDADTYAALQAELATLRQHAKASWNLDHSAGVAARFQRLADNGLGILYQFRLDPDGTTSFPYISASCQPLLGLEPELVMQDPAYLMNLTHPEDVERLKASIAQSAATLQPWLWEGRLQLAGGVVKWIKAESRPYRQPEGAVVWDGWMLEVTEYKRTEADLQAAGDRVAQILAGTSDAFFALDRQWRFTQVNHHAEYLLGKPAAVLLGNNVWELYPTTVGSSFERYYHQAWETGETVTFEEYYPPLDIWYEVRAYTAGDELFVYFTSINARKKLELSYQELSELKEQLEAHIAERTAELERTTAQLAAVLENSPTVIYAKDQHGKYLLVNRQYEVIFNLNSAAILGKSDDDLFPQAIAEKVRANDQQVLASGQPLHLEEVVPHQDGGLHTYVSVKFPLRDAQGTIYGVCGISTDITERKQAEARLREALALQDAILNSTNYSIISTDAQGLIQTFNTAAANLTGYAAAEVVGRMTPGLFHDPEEVVKRSQELSQELGVQIEPGFETLVAKARRGQLDERQWTYLHKEGCRIPMLLSVTALRDEAGEITGFVGLGNDITERLHAEATQRKLAAVIENSSDFIGLCDLEGNIQYVNPAGLQLVGLPDLDAVLRTTMLDYLASECRPIFEQDVLATLETQGTWRGEFYFHHFETGAALPVEATFFLVRHPDTQEPLCLATVTRDIRERQQAEAVLRETTENLQDAQRLARIGNWSYNLHSEELQWSEEVFRLFGRDRHLGEPNLEAGIAYYAPEDRPRLEQALAHTAETQKPCALELQIVRDDGTRGYVRVQAEAVTAADGQPLRLFGTVMDITERKQAELTLQQQKQELEETLQELRTTQAHLIQSEKMSGLGQLVAGIAHEINNPVNFIYGNLVHTEEYGEGLLEIVQAYQAHCPEPGDDLQDLIETHDLEFLIQDFPRLLASMKLGAERIRAIVTSLRTFSRLDEAECKEADIHEGLDSTLLILQNRLKAKSDRPAIEIVKNYGPRAVVECYPSQLNQVFMNILANALDAIEERDSQRSRAEKQADPSRIWLTTAEEQPGWLTIRLRDNGPGIPAEVQQRIFDPFFTTKPTGKGTGLGMSISYQIVTERHGGTLTCCSEPGQGAEFAITIPCHQPGAQDR